MLYKDDLITEFGSTPRRNYPEDALQEAVCTFLRWALPYNALYWAVPNGGKRHTTEAARMSRLGVRAGIPDLHVVYAKRLYCLELKAPRGKLSASQVQTMGRLEECGIPVATVRSVEDVEHILKAWGIPLSARLS